MMMNTKHGMYTCLTLWKPWKRPWPMLSWVREESSFRFTFIDTSLWVSQYKGEVYPVIMIIAAWLLYRYVYILRCNPGWSQIHSPVFSISFHHVPPPLNILLFLSTLQIRSFYIFYAILASWENNSELYRVVSFPFHSGIQKVVH